MIRADPRANRSCCPAFGAPLAAAAEIRRSWHLIRSGEWLGCRGEFATVRRSCGEERLLLWTVQMTVLWARAASPSCVAA